jgi:hypothetical protein
MSLVFDDYCIKDSGGMSVPDVTQMRTDSNHQFVILASVEGSFCDCLPLILFANTHLPFGLSKRVR